MRFLGGAGIWVACEVCVESGILSASSKKWKSRSVGSLQRVALDFRERRWHFV